MPTKGGTAADLPAARNGQATAPDFAPVPRRTRRPRWLDWRILAGLVLVIGSVVLGAKIIGGSSRVVPVIAVTRDLAPGTVLTAADLTASDVNLGLVGDRYLAADPSTIVGQALTSWVYAGDLLPSSALAPSPDGRVLPVSVDASRMPPGVTHGSVIDLYLLRGGQGAGANTDRIAASVTVQDVKSPDIGGLSGAAGDVYQITLLLDQPTADKLIRVLPTGEPMILLATRR